MEYFQHGTLDRFITQELGERDAQTISLQLLEGLRIMHEEQFTHRDLKPQVSKAAPKHGTQGSPNRTYSSSSKHLTGGSRLEILVSRSALSVMVQHCEPARVRRSISLLKYFTTSLRWTKNRILTPTPSISGRLHASSTRCWPFKSRL